MTNAPSSGNNFNQGSMTGVGGQRANAGREGMTHADPRNSMTSTPQDYNATQGNSEKRQGHGFFKRLLFHYDIREIEAELQSIKSKKTDLVQSGYALSELGFFDLFFRLIPSVSIAITAIFISILIFILLSPISIVLAIIASFLFLQITISISSKIIYSLDKHKIGKEETGRFIETVRSVWHFFEFIFVSMVLLLAMLYFSNIDWAAYAEKIQNYHFKMEFAQKIYTKLLDTYYVSFSLSHIEQILQGILLMLMLYLLSYVVSNYIVYSKSKQLEKKNLFEMEKEYLNPAELARKNFDF